MNKCVRPNTVAKMENKSCSVLALHGLYYYKYVPSSIFEYLSEKLIKHVNEMPFLSKVSSE